VKHVWAFDEFGADFDPENVGRKLGAILQTKFSDRWQGNRSPKALSINGAENLSDEERLSGKTYADSGRSSHPNGFAIT
jgi:hypothetical protein